MNLERNAACLLVALLLNMAAGTPADAGANDWMTKSLADVFQPLSTARIERAQPWVQPRIPAARLAFDAAQNAHRAGCRQLAIHPGGRDSHALLTARLTQLVKLRTVEQLAEDARDLLLDDARTVVLDGDEKAIVAKVRHFDADLG